MRIDVHAHTIPRAFRRLADAYPRAERDAAFRERLRTDPEGALSGLPLSDTERPALAAGDVATLYRLGAHTFLMSRLPRLNVPAGLTRPSTSAASLRSRPATDPPGPGCRMV